MFATWARACFGATALLVLAGLVIQLPVSAANTASVFPTPLQRALNVFAFFTIESNLLVGITTGLLAVRLDRPSALFRALRLCGVIAITVTFVVYHLVLAGLTHLTGWGVVANDILHTAVPILAVAGWLVFGPRRQTGAGIVAYSVVFPLLWTVFTLVRGAFIGWYPYPFLDVTALGYGRVLVNVAVVAVLFVGLGAAAAGVDDRLPDQLRPRVS